MSRFNEAGVGNFYGEHKGKPFYNNLSQFIQTDVVTGMELVAQNAVDKWRQVIGATNSNGEHPIHNELSPQDIHATIYHHLGIDYKQTYNNPAGRPIHICYGNHIQNWG